MVFSANSESLWQIFLLFMIPSFCKFQNARADVERERVGERTAFFDKSHRGLRIVSLRDEDARAHRHAAVTSVGAMCVDLAAVANRFERGVRARDQFRNREREEWTVYALQPQYFDRRRIWVGLGRLRKTHVDNEPHAEVAQ